MMLALSITENTMINDYKEKCGILFPPWDKKKITELHHFLRIMSLYLTIFFVNLHSQFRIYSQNSEFTL